MRPRPPGRGLFLWSMCRNQVGTGVAATTNQPQLPPLLRTLAVPPFGMQVGAPVSEPSASPPPVAVACTKLPSASQLASTVEPPVAIPVALHFPSALTLAKLPPVALAVATPFWSASTNASLPGPDAWAVDLPLLSDSASAVA